MLFVNLWSLGSIQNSHLIMHHGTIGLQNHQSKRFIFTIHDILNTQYMQFYLILMIKIFRCRTTRLREMHVSTMNYSMKPQIPKIPTIPTMIVTVYRFKPLSTLISNSLRSLYSYIWKPLMLEPVESKCINKRLLNNIGLSTTPHGKTPLLLAYDTMFMFTRKTFISNTSSGGKS